MMIWKRSFWGGNNHYTPIKRVAMPQYGTYVSVLDL